MTHRHHLPHVTRVLVACSPTYHNHRAIMEAIGSIFLDTIEEQREYYYFACPAMSEIFDDGALSPLSFRELAHEDPEIKQTLQNLKFTYVVAKTHSSRSCFRMSAEVERRWYVLREGCLRPILTGPPRQRRRS